MIQPHRDDIEGRAVLAAELCRLQRLLYHPDPSAPIRRPSRTETAMTTETDIPEAPAGMSAQIHHLASALSKAQGEIHAASKDRKNPHFGSTYATLASVWDAVREPLAKHGLSVVQPCAYDAAAKSVQVATILLHSSGQWIRSDLSMPVVKTDPQGVGSAITYGRRYALSSLVGVAPDDDDDGNAASGGRQAPRVETIDAEQIAELEQQLAATKTDRARFLQFLAIKQLADLPAAQYSRALGALAKKAATRQAEPQE